MIHSWRHRDYTSTLSLNPQASILNPQPPPSRLHLRLLYIALVFISVHKFEASCTHARARAHPRYISSDQNIRGRALPRLNNRTQPFRQKELNVSKNTFPAKKGSNETKRRRNDKVRDAAGKK